MIISPREMQDRFTIYIGFSDKDKRVQLFAMEKLLKLINTVCAGYQVSFSYYSCTGGYCHEDGQAIIENSIAVALIGATEEQVNSIAGDLCAFLNQESVYIVRDTVDSWYVNDSLRG